MAKLNEVLAELADLGITYNPESDIFTEGDIASEVMLEKFSADSGFGAEMAAYVTEEGMEIVSIRNSATIIFEGATAEDAAEEIRFTMEKFYRDLA